jgi:mycofactocin precursor
MEPAITIETGATPAEAASAGAGELVEEELLVEEISIDGMCGVY